jgi:outer membrane protein TolC
MVEKSLAPTVSFLPLARAGAFVMALVCTPAWSLDLSQAYQAALEQDSTIRSVRAATDARRERLPQARSQLLPNLSASSSRYRNSLERTAPDFFGRLVTSDERYTSSSETLTLRQPLFRKLLIADYRQAEAQVTMPMPSWSGSCKTSRFGSVALILRPCWRRNSLH